jgi:excisionase family DNA binding protein
MTEKKAQLENAISPVVPRNEVKRLLGISDGTLRAIIRRGDLKAVQLSPRRVGVRRDELERYTTRGGAA